MTTRILFVGLDIDDQQFHGASVSDDGKERFEFYCKPNVGSLAKKLEPFKAKGFTIQVCYEATFFGFSLSRALRSKEILCDVIAPSLIPEVSGPRVKTDRLDCRKLAEYYRAGLLTKVHEPDGDDERVRDLIRSRGFIMRQLLATRKHIIAICRRMNLDYRQEKGKPSASHWTDQHHIWLERKMGNATGSAMGANLSLMLMHMRQLEGQLTGYDEEVRKLAESEKYQVQARALSCFREIDVLTAMVFISELGGILRFTHPRQLTSYVGLDLSEYSSGGNRFRLRITKMGNRFIRTAVRGYELEGSRYSAIYLDQTPGSFLPCLPVIHMRSGWSAGRWIKTHENDNGHEKVAHRHPYFVDKLSH